MVLRTAFLLTKNTSKHLKVHIKNRKAVHSAFQSTYTITFTITVIYHQDTVAIRSVFKFQDLLTIVYLFLPNILKKYSEIMTRRK